MELKKERERTRQKKFTRTLERRDDSQTSSGQRVEARDILTGAADVVVTDGFTGNAVVENNRRNNAYAMMGLLKEGIKGQRHLRKTWSALIKNMPSTGLREHIGLPAKLEVRCSFGLIRSSREISRVLQNQIACTMR